MTDHTTDNKRIAKNTLVLYVRMLLMMFVSLYTSRVVLSILGIEDFGIYNVVGGVVSMLSFINGSMASSTQRYLMFALGRGKFQEVQKVFSTSLQIHVIIAVIVIILAETVGLWFLQNKMTIPTNRSYAALWVYQLSVLTSVVMIISVPYNAVIIAHERMSAFAYISILEALLKLGITFMLLLCHSDRLIFYAILVFLLQILIRIIYGRYCNKHFEETKRAVLGNKTLFKSMLKFASWTLWGSCAYITFTQGLNILLNMFFGPSVNAARAIAVQVQSAVTQFSANFQTALNPQITKSYAANEMVYMHILIYKSARYTFLLLLMLSMPILLETETILSIWLKEVPDYTVQFIRLMLCVTIIDAMANSLMAAANATGKLKVYQAVVGSILLAILPISYIALKLGGSPVSVFIVHLIVVCIAFIVRLMIIYPLIKLPILDFTLNVILRCAFVAFIASIVPFTLHTTMPNNILNSAIVCIVSFLSVGLTTYKFGLNVNERNLIYGKAKKALSKLHE